MSQVATVRPPYSRKRLIANGVRLGGTFGAVLSLAYAVISLVFLQLYNSLLSNHLSATEKLLSIVVYPAFLVIPALWLVVLPCTILGALTGLIVAFALSLLSAPPSRFACSITSLLVACAITALLNIVMWDDLASLQLHLEVFGIPTIIYLIAALHLGRSLWKANFADRVADLTTPNPHPAA
ncbi:MAG TPA: hypothetical protein VI729_01570 [Anaerolineales bacterium]|nr:hypothetical protein [Anaerolineales bacterium]